MKRKCKIVRRIKGCKVEILVDAETMNEIFDYIGESDRRKKKFLDIVKIIMEGLHNRHLYRREGFDAETKDITAMRLHVGQENDRIYCKEISRKDSEGESIKVVIMGILHFHKETRKQSEEEKRLIKKLAKYEYDIE